MLKVEPSTCCETVARQEDVQCTYINVQGLALCGGLSQARLLVLLCSRFIIDDGQHLGIHLTIKFVIPSTSSFTCPARPACLNSVLDLDWQQASANSSQPVQLTPSARTVAPWPAPELSQHFPPRRRCCCLTPLAATVSGKRILTLLLPTPQQLRWSPRVSRQRTIFTSLPRMTSCFS